VAFYDSTMARFWFLNDGARDKIVGKLAQIDVGNILSDFELRELGTYFGNHKYGETIFLMKPGHMIVPSFMSRRILPGMHGYHPDDPDSFAVYLSNKTDRGHVTSISEVLFLE
jgi:hypothetical protein